MGRYWKRWKEMGRGRKVKEEIRRYGKRWEGMGTDEQGRDI